MTGLSSSGRHADELPRDEDLFQLSSVDCGACGPRPFLHAFVLSFDAAAGSLNLRLPSGTGDLIFARQGLYRDSRDIQESGVGFSSEVVRQHRLQWIVAHDWRAVRALGMNYERDSFTSKVGRIP
jgi:hypothetical protein